MCSENNLQKSILPLHHVGLIDLTGLRLGNRQVTLWGISTPILYFVYEQYQHINTGSIWLIDNMFIKLWALYLNF